MNFEEAFNPVRALQSSWELVKRAPAPMLLGGIILLITGDGSGSNGGGSWDSKYLDKQAWEEIRPYLFGIIGFICCLGIFFFLLSSWVYVGFAHTIEKLMRTGAANAGDVFDAKDRWVAMLVTRFLVAAIQFAATLPLLAAILLPIWGASEDVLHPALAVAIGGLAVLIYLPIMVYVLLGLMLAKQVCAFEGVGAGESMHRSWTMASGHRLTLLGFWIVTAIVSFMGICMCCVGVFFTGTLATIAPFESYLAFTRGGELDQWWIRTRNTGVNAPIDWSSPPPASA